MTDNDIKELLNSKELSVIEDTVSGMCKMYVNKEFIDFTIGILRREISNSGLSLEYIRSYFRLKKDLIIKFGIKLNNTLKNTPLEEEYPAGEGIPKSEKSKVIASHGLGIGFSVKYAIYLHFLETNPNDLLDYIKKERIPKAQKFHNTLKEIYNS